MRFLQICHKPPYPAVDGGSIAMFNLAKGLTDCGVDVHILAMNTFKQRCEPHQIPEKLDFGVQYELHEMDIRVKPVSAFLNLFTHKSYNLSRFYSESFADRITNILNQHSFDAIILESLFVTPYIELIRNIYSGPLILRSHNVEFRIWENLSRHESNFIKKWYLGLLSRRLKKYEIKAWNEVDFIASISEEDNQVMESLGVSSPKQLIAFGIDPKKTEPVTIHSDPNVNLLLYHIGSMNWKPHQEGFRWFIRKVLPSFKESSDQLELHLAGTGMPDWLIKIADSKIIVTDGYVNGEEYSKNKQILIVPSFSGSGVSVKVIEAMAAGKVILSTKNGARGIACQNGKDIYIADDPDEWIKILHDLASRPKLVEEVSLNARQFILDHHDYLSCARELLEAIKSLQGN